MKNGRVFLSLALAFLAGCHPPVLKVSTTVTNTVGGVETDRREIKTEGNVWPDGLERIQHGAILGRVPGEQTHVDVQVSSPSNAGGPNTGGGGGYTEPQIRVPRQNLMPGTVPYKIQAAVDAARAKEDSNF